MGILGETPAQRKKKAIGLLDTTKDGKDPNRESWQWGPYESLLIGDAISHPTEITGTAAGAPSDSPDPSKHLISPSITGSSSPASSSMSYTTTSPPFSGGCADRFGVNSATHRRLKKGSDSSLSFVSCNGDFQPSRWDGSPDTSFREGSSRPGKGSICKCAAGATADVAAVCCCPFSVLHLLAIAFIKLPTALASKMVNRIKRKVVKKRKKSSVHEDDDESVAATSYPPSRCRSYEAGDIRTWEPALAFGDQSLWREFDSDSQDTEVWNGEEHLNAKS